MDPKRNKLETILKLPTHRLLNVYRIERSYFPYTKDPNIEHRLSAMKEELDKREHLSK